MHWSSLHWGGDVRQIVEVCRAVSLSKSVNFGSREGPYLRKQGSMTEEDTCGLSYACMYAQQHRYSYHRHKREYVESPENQWVRTVGQLANRRLWYQESRDTYTSQIQDKAQYDVTSSDGLDFPSMEPVLRKMKLSVPVLPIGRRARIQNSRAS